jgi:hypothetical protein
MRARIANTYFGSVIGTFIPAKYCARIFKEQNTPGSIVMIASMSGQIANRVCHFSTTNWKKLANVNKIGTHMYRLQLFEGSSPPNVSLRCTGMGPIWCPREHPLRWCMF